MTVDFVEVKVEEGILRGREEQSDGLTSIKYFSFLGIPYAKHPIGDLRFKEPQPLDPWDGVRDALEEGSPSVQNGMIPGDIQGSEDCLYLNVYTPVHPHNIKKLRPVLFSMHGGGFAIGSGNKAMTPPDIFIEQDVLFVAPNYRLGALGFLSLQNDEVSGNCGLKDLYEALRWTRRNIKKFAGDPDNVTVIGMSSGAAAIEYFLVSDLSRGMFKQAICQCATSLSPGLMNSKPRSLAVKLAESLGYVGDTEDDTALLNFLKQCPANDIVRKQTDLTSFQERMLFYSLTFAPCVEKEGKGLKFLTRNPKETFQNGDFYKVPVIIGHSTVEGSIMLSPILRVDVDLINKNWEILIPVNMDVPKSETTEVATEIMRFYFDCKPVSWDNIHPLINLVGDVVIHFGMNKTTSLMAAHSPYPVYSYRASKVKTNSMSQMLFEKAYPDVHIQGAPHCSETEFLYKFKIPNLPASTDFTPEEKIFAKTLSTMLTTFCKTGNPNCEKTNFPGWEATTSSNPQYLDLGDDLKMIKGTLYEERLQFWEHLYKKYGYLY
uniref:Carboxylesterase type B domain-containing protein n=2 Tax=Clastoptera arizonana TaxID=38151 RepID=A0A1B6CWD7_9HEMI